MSSAFSAQKKTRRVNEVGRELGAELFNPIRVQHQLFCETSSKLRSDLRFLPPPHFILSPAASLEAITVCLDLSVCVFFNYSIARMGCPPIFKFYILVIIFICIKVSSFISIDFYGGGLCHFMSIDILLTNQLQSRGLYYLRIQRYWEARGR